MPAPPPLARDPRFLPSCLGEIRHGRPLAPCFVVRAPAFAICCASAQAGARITKRVLALRPLARSSLGTAVSAAAMQPPRALLSAGALCYALARWVGGICNPKPFSVVWASLALSGFAPRCRVGVRPYKARAPARPLLRGAGSSLRDLLRKRSGWSPHHEARARPAPSRSFLARHSGLGRCYAAASGSFVGWRVVLRTCPLGGWCLYS